MKKNPDVMIHQSLTTGTIGSMRPALGSSPCRGDSEHWPRARKNRTAVCHEMMRTAPFAVQASRHALAVIDNVSRLVARDVSLLIARATPGSPHGCRLLRPSCSAKCDSIRSRTGFSLSIRQRVKTTQAQIPEVLVQVSSDGFTRSQTDSKAGFLPKCRSTKHRSRSHESDQLGPTTRRQSLRTSLRAPRFPACCCRLKRHLPSLR